MIFLLLNHNDEKHKKLTSDAGTVVFFGWGGCFSYVKIFANFVSSATLLGIIKITVEKQMDASI